MRTAFGPLRCALPTGWTSRAVIQIVGTQVAEITNTTVQVTVPFRAGMRSDFYDLRFYGSDGAQLGYWRRSYTESTSADCVVEIASIPATPGVTWIWMVWGNASAPDTSDETILPLIDSFGAHPVTGFAQGWARPSLVSQLPLPEWVANPNEMDPFIVWTETKVYIFVDAAQAKIFYYSVDPEDFDDETKWVRHDPVLTVTMPGHGIANAVAVGSPNPIQMPDGSWRMYSSIGQLDSGRVVWYGAMATCSAAEFPDTWHWQPAPLTGLVPTPGTWDEGGVQAQTYFPPWVCPDGKWHVMLGGYDLLAHYWYIETATSTDGLTWTKDGNKFDWGPAGTFDHAGQYPCTGYAISGGVFYVPYTGYDGWCWRTGMFTTTDFVNFTRAYNEPLQPEMPKGTGWGEASCEVMTLHQKDDGSLIGLFSLATNHSGGHGEPASYSSGQLLGRGLSSLSISDKLDPSKWVVRNWNGPYYDVVNPYPQLVDGKMILSTSASMAGILCVVGQDAFASGTIECKFDLTYLPDGSSLSVGFGLDGSHYTLATIYNSGDTQYGRSNWVVNGSGGSGTASAVAYASGYLRVHRSGAITKFYVRQSLTDAWTQLGGALNEAQTGLKPLIIINGVVDAAISQLSVSDTAPADPIVTVCEAA